MTSPSEHRTWRDYLAIAVIKHVNKPMIGLVGDPLKLRRSMDLSIRLFQHVPRGTHVIRDGDKGLWVTPPGVAHDASVLFYCHGGGFIAGSPETHLGMVSHLAGRAGLRAYLPRYALAPEQPFPAGRNDLRARYKALLDAGQTPVALAGDSAGGTLALLLAQHIRDHGWPAPRAMVLMSPAGSLDADVAKRLARAEDEMMFPERTLNIIRAAYLGTGDGGSADASPLAGDLTGLPPAHIHASRAEALAPDSIALAQRMDDASVALWPGLPHVWHIFAGRLPVADAAIGDLSDFLKARI